MEFEPFPKQTLVFTSLQYKSFENTVGMSNFSVSHCVFYPFGELRAIFTKFKIVVCKLFKFGWV